MFLLLDIVASSPPGFCWCLVAILIGEGGHGGGEAGMASLW